MVVGNRRFPGENFRGLEVFLWKNRSRSSIIGRSGVILLPGLFANCKKSGIFWAGTIYDGLCEAMTNTMDHAYQDAEIHLTKFPILKSQWWMTGSVTNCGSEIEVVFFDQGISIPIHLPKNKSEKIREYINNIFDSQASNDAMMIKAAMDISRSATHETNRGKGLDQIQKLIELSEEGKLRILSRKGEYIYDYEKGEKPKVKTNELEGDIGGTLIHWHLIVRSG